MQQLFLRIICWGRNGRGGCDIHRQETFFVDAVGQPVLRQIVQAEDGHLRAQQAEQAQQLQPEALIMGRAYQFRIRFSKLQTETVTAGAVQLCVKQQDGIAVAITQATQYCAVVFTVAIQHG